MFRRIGFRLIIAVGATGLLIIGIYSVFSVRFQRESLLSEVERHASQLSETVKRSTRYAMMLNQREHVHKIINDVGADPAMYEVRVLNKEGKIIYSSRQEHIGQMVDKRAESCFACHAADMPLERLSLPQRQRIFRIHPDSARVLGIITPIYNEPGCWQAECHAHSRTQSVLGVLDVTISLEEVDHMIALSEFENVVFAISAVVAISFIIGFFVRRWVNKPVETLLAAMREVGSGNLAHRVPNPGEDDLGTLARSFNAMTQKLSEARLQLTQSDKMASLGRLAAGVAHELNNPLTGVLTYSSFHLNRVKDNPDLKADLEVIVRETTRSREIVKNLLDFARQSVPRKSQADLNEIIRRSVTLFESQAAVKGIQVIQHLAERLPLIRVDVNQMEQVLMNLLVNAGDAIGDRGGSITLTSRTLVLPPQGVVQIKKALCPNGHDLTDGETKVDGMPAVKLRFRREAREGVLYLDPVYGRTRHSYDPPVGDRDTVEVSCPRCNALLLDAGTSCPRCSAPTYALHVPPRGMLQGCTRRGCPWQVWEAVDAEGSRQYVELTVTDTGSGIPRNELHKIFEPFFTTKGQKGTGLGLAVIWGIIDNHNGTIGVRSEEGQGTTFTIRLPYDHQR